MIDKRVIDQLLSDRDLIASLEWKLFRRLLPWAAAIQCVTFIVYWLLTRIWKP